MNGAVLSKLQIKILRLPLSGIHLLQGPTSSGKSFVANLKLYLSLTDPQLQGESFLATAPSYASLWQNVLHPILHWDRLFQLLTVRKEGSRPVILCKKNHNRLLAVSCACAQSVAVIQGHNLRFWLADEAVLHSESFIDMALSRLRYVKNHDTHHSLSPGVAFWSYNPSHSQHFLKRRFVNVAHPMSSITLYPFSLQDNPTFTPEWGKRLHSLFSGVFFQQMVQAQWSSPHALVYPQFTSDLVRPASTFDHQWHKSVLRFFWGADWGFSHPMAIVLVAQTKQGFVVLDELYRTQTLVDRQLFSHFHNPSWFSAKLAGVFADRSRPDLIDSLDKLLQRRCSSRHVPVMPSTSPMQQGLHQVMQLLAQKKILFSQTCEHTLREISQYRFRSSMPDQPEKSSDHAMDALRYVISMASLIDAPLTHTPVRDRSWVHFYQQQGISSS